jgi:hypothetical protein
MFLDQDANWAALFQEGSRPGVGGFVRPERTESQRNRGSIATRSLRDTPAQAQAVTSIATMQKAIPTIRVVGFMKAVTDDFRRARSARRVDLRPHGAQLQAGMVTEHRQAREHHQENRGWFWRSHQNLILAICAAACVRAVRDVEIAGHR